MSFNYSFLTLALTSWVSTGSVWASPIAYTPVPGASGQTGIRFAIDFDLGTHEGIAQELRGAAIVDWDASRVVSARFEVPVISMRSKGRGQTERDCHMHEALGTENNNTPEEEPDPCEDDGTLVLTYPVITLELASPIDFPINIEPGQAVQVIAATRWQIHGRTKQYNLPLQLVMKESALNGKREIELLGQIVFSLKAHKIIVRSFGFIDVEDEATVEISLKLSPE